MVFITLNAAFGVQIAMRLVRSAARPVRDNRNHIAGWCGTSINLEMLSELLL